MSKIPEDIVAFISKYIKSVGQLEILLLLREKKDRGWSADDISVELRNSAAWASDELANFHALGLLTKNPSEIPIYQFPLMDQNLEMMVSSLAQVYLTYRYTVIDLIYNKSAEPIREFANAFKLRREK